MNVRVQKRIGIRHLCCSIRIYVFFQRVRGRNDLCGPGDVAAVDGRCDKDWLVRAGTKRNN